MSLGSSQREAADGVPPGTTNNTRQPTLAPPTSFTYSRWRHGGWYVHDVRYPSGACGCVSRNFADRKWRIVCDPRPFDQQTTFPSRDAAAKAEWEMVNTATPPAVNSTPRA